MDKEQITQSIGELVAGFRVMPYLFIGSGFSRRYAGAPSWEGLLKGVCGKLFPGDEHAFERVRREAAERAEVDMADDVDGATLYPHVGTILQKEFNQRCNQDRSFEKEAFPPEALDEVFSGGLDYFRAHIARTVSSLQCVPTKELKIFGRIANKIAGVITTNYDCLLEKFFPDLAVRVGQSDLLVAQTDAAFNLYKIHGCCRNPNSIVITDADYRKFDERLCYLSAKMLTVFVEHPVIFIGYSMSDRNVLEILRQISRALDKRQLERLRDNLIFVSHAHTPEKEQITRREIGGVEMTELCLYDFSPLYHAIEGIRCGLPVRILRQLQGMVREFVTTTKKHGNVVVASLDSASLEGKELGLYIGEKNQVANVGFEFYDLEAIIHDILYDDNPALNSPQIYKTFKLLRRSNGQGYLPVHKYWDNIVKNVETIPGDWKIIKSFADLRLTTGEEQYAKKISKTSSIEEIINQYRDNQYYIFAGILKFIEDIDTDELGKFLQRQIANEEHYQKNKSEIRKLTAWYDYKKYGIAKKK